MSELRSRGIWVNNGNSAVRTLISECIICKKFREDTCQQKMRALPVERLTVTPPFTYVGLDLFGPFTVKEGRKELKRYGAVFTCLPCRAIYLDVVNSMNTDCFIQSPSRFIARCGNVRLIKCDNGTNFVVGESELKHAFTVMNDNKIKFFLANVRIDWMTSLKNPRAASHMDRVWEQQIRSYQYCEIMEQASTMSHFKH